MTGTNPRDSRDTSRPRLQTATLNIIVRGTEPIPPRGDIDYAEAMTADADRDDTTPSLLELMQDFAAMRARLEDSERLHAHYQRFVDDEAMRSAKLRQRMDEARCRLLDRVYNNHNPKLENGHG